MLNFIIREKLCFTTVQSFRGIFLFQYYIPKVNTLPMSIPITSIKSAASQYVCAECNTVYAVGVTSLMRSITSFVRSTTSFARSATSFICVRLRRNDVEQKFKWYCVLRTQMKKSIAIELYPKEQFYLPPKKTKTAENMLCGRCRYAK